ncbi:histidine biosynthesis trifunctional-protein [Thelephora terrestris]|uniref:Histidine biosynthesis trifunctional protein n=1 Tax=Thelephora terrestris TaxID=56493 RepID=A0A9P6L2P3_9AGAM|nr:histidine biosynthesis trifunctional-protein [Thelephora terrestris]
MSPGFLPLLRVEDKEIVSTLSRLGPLLVPFQDHSNYQFPALSEIYLFVDNETAPDPDHIISLLDSGIQKVVVPVSLAKQLAPTVPKHRLLLLLDVANVSAVTETFKDSVSGVLLKTPTLDPELISSVSKFFSKSSIFVLPASQCQPSRSSIREISNVGAALVIATDQLSTSASTDQRLHVVDAFLASITSDRADGLFPTVVSSYTQGDTVLGLVYSSTDSIKESILTGKGVYQSRKHGLWRKGETSGAVQEVVKIRLDCDSDALQFSVIQHGEGFCHLNRSSCFGELAGLAALEKTLQARFESAPEGSYTSRLFNDSALLRSKIMEEADELCQATSREEVAFEAADLIYFALTRCVAGGVSVADIERSLDAKAKKITRRKGDAKPQWVSATPEVIKPLPPKPQSIPAPPPLPQEVEIDPFDPIRMRTYDLSQISLSQRADLLRRPVLRSSEMMAKVQPIVEEVRLKGDAALLDFTAKFDKVKLQSPDEVREAIDKAYSNIYKFHKAQAKDDALVVETMPGVVCSRFARPIARVGLYIPGGTAVLPSTALMLGIPAQVAGCHQIVFATPPRRDGTLSPEVVYVAHLIGASAILKAGGAQAIAALAYGTENVPKVDKIFGPGNQWVTAAKMLVQNDTDALVSIDMPAGPSEVLVIADETANPAFVAADLLSQAEHGVDSQVVLLTVNLPQETIAKIEEEVDSQARALPRADIMRQSIPKSLLVQTRSVKEAIDFSNDYAPEHLILHVRDAKDLAEEVQNAGSVFIGPYSPESCGDYASGTNHTLPTNGYARQFSGVNTQSFQKHITSQELTKDGLKVLGPIVATLADVEGLGAHANAVRIRLRELQA